MKNKKNGFISNLTAKKVVLSSLATTMIAAPIPVVMSVTNQNSGTFMLDDKQFSSVDSAVNYIKQNAQKNYNIEEGNSKWSIKMNNKILKFNTPEALREYIFSNYVQTKTYLTNINVANYVDETNQVGNDNQFWKNVKSFNAQDQTTENLTKTIYQAKNDVAVQSVDEAIESYFESHDAYYFNNIYFNNQSDLKQYLVSEYLPKNQQTNSITITGPNGKTSNAISLTDPQSAINEINSFINNNAIQVLSYTNENNETIDINIDNYKSKLDQINTNDLSYLHVQSNQGNSRYVIDNKDNANLIGPYFYNGVLDTGAFQNKSMWKKVNNLNRVAYANSKIDSMIGQFFSSIIVDDNAINIYESKMSKKVIPIFRTSLLAHDLNENTNQTEQVSLDDWYMKQLAKYSPELAKEVEKTNFTLMSGNKYNTFYKIPIMYSFILQRIVSWSLPQMLMDITNFYFGKVCDYIQEALELVLVDQSLLTNSYGETLEIRKLFQIGNNEYNINTSMEYFLGELKRFPKVIAAMDAYIAAYNNILMTSGLMPFIGYSPDHLFEYGVITETEYYNNYSKFETVFTTFSQTNYDNMLASFMPNATNPKIKAIAQQQSSTWDKALDELVTDRSAVSYGILLKNIGLQNTQHHTLARTILNNEIRIYIGTGAILTDGYLELLYSNNPQVNKLDTFVKFVMNNPNIDSYKAYLAYLIDVRNNLNAFDNSSSSNNNSFTKGLLSVLTYGLGSTYVVGTTLNSLYKSSLSASNSSLFNNYKVNSNPSFKNGTIPQPETHSLWEVLANGNDVIPNTSTRSMSNNEEFKAVTKSGVEKVNNQHQVNKNTRATYIDIDNVDELPYYNFDADKQPPKVPLRETNWDLYAMPEQLRNKFNVVRTTSFDSDIEEIKQSFSWLSDYGVEVDWNDKFDTSSRIDLSFSSSNAPNSSNQIRNVVGSLNSEKPIKVIDGNGKLTDLSINYGSKSDLKDLKLLFMTDELDAINNSNFKTRSTSISSSISLSSFWSTTGSYDVSPSLPSRPQSTTFSHSFRKKISGTRLVEAVSTAWNSTQNFGKKAASLVKKVMAPVLSTALAGLEIAFFVFTLINVEYIKDSYVYATPDGTQFIWDGGITSSRFMGLEQKQEVGISEMQLMEPVTITLPQVEEFYYYNGIKYYNPNELKKDQIEYMLKNNFVDSNGKFKMNYTLGQGNYASLAELKKAFYEDIKVDPNKPDFNNMNKSSKYISSSNYAFSNNLVVNSGNYTTIAEEISKNIRKTKIALLPEFDLTNKTTGKIKKFVYPGRYYEAGKIKENTDKTMEYIVDNSANMVTNPGQTTPDFVNKDANSADAKSYENLKNEFVKRLSGRINFKNILDSEWISIEKNFSSMVANWNIVNLYIVSLNNRTAYFTTLEDANNYVLNSLGFKKEVVKNKVVSYTYDGIHFANDQILTRWVNANIKKI